MRTSYRYRGLKMTPSTWDAPRVPDRPGGILRDLRSRLVLHAVNGDPCVAAAAGGEQASAPMAAAAAAKPTRWMMFIQIIRFTGANCDGLIRKMRH